VAGPSVPPHAIVPEAFDDPPEIDRTVIDAPVEPNDARIGELRTSADEDDGEVLLPEPSIPIEMSASMPLAAFEAEVPDLEPSPPARTPMSSVASRDTRVLERAPRARWPWIAALVGAGIAVTLGVQMTKTDAHASGTGTPVTLDQATAPALTGVPVVNDPSGVTYASIPVGFAVPAGEGMLEVNAAPGTAVRVDGVARGSGLVRIPVSAGPHAIGVAALERSIEVRAGRAAHVELTTP
jgi:hypothetical protein